MFRLPELVVLAHEAYLIAVKIDQVKSKIARLKQLKKISDR